MARNLAGHPPVDGASALLVGHLMASAPPRSMAENVASTSASLAGHVLLLALALWLTTGHGPKVLAAARRVELFFPAQPTQPPVPEPPVLPRTGDPTPTAPGPRIDFGILTAPHIIPGEIPVPRPGLAIDESMYGDAIGTVGGDLTAGGRPGSSAAASGAEHRPDEFVPVTVNPELQNRPAIERALQRAYPPLLRDAGVTGDVLVWVFLNEEGMVTKTQIKQTSGVPQLDEAALGVAAQMRFSPALNRDVHVKVWVAVPIRFRMGE